MAKTNQDEVVMDRRRTQDDRRELAGDAAERKPVERRKVQRRRQIDPTTCERDYSGDEIQFMQALDVYKRRSGRMFPTCSEILEVIRDLGYVRPADVQHEESQDLAADGASESELESYPESDAELLGADDEEKARDAELPLESV